MDVNTATEFGALIRTARRAKSITLRTFATTISVSPAYHSKVEAGFAIPANDVISRIARELELDANELCGMAGKLTPDVERKLSKIARTDPSYFRTMVERFGGSR